MVLFWKCGTLTNGWSHCQRKSAGADAQESRVSMLSSRHVHANPISLIDENEVTAGMLAVGRLNHRGHYLMSL